MIKLEKVICNRCSRSYLYDRSHGHTRTQCNSCTVNKKRAAVKKWAIDYKGGKCMECGYSKCPRALCFHHVISDEKDFSINAKSAAISKEKLRKELDKCVLLCSNCHMEEHQRLDLIKYPYLNE